tara:strand:+ start:1474 stop:2214 length:741 start_codon:yes stop_codon:yes gene_type:complete
MEVQLRNYLRIKQLKANIKVFLTVNGFSPEETQKISENPHQYQWKNFEYEDAPFGLRILPEGQMRLAAKYGGGLFISLHNIKERMKSGNVQKTVIDKAMEATELYASTELKTTFPSMFWYVTSSLSNGVSANLQRSYMSDVDVHLPVTWTKKIYDKGIARVKAGDGMRFIMNCEERKLSRINDDGIKAWSVVAMKVKGKKPDIEAGWVMRYKTSDGAILSYQKEFSRCESLLRRRIKDTVMRELMN